MAFPSSIKSGSFCSVCAGNNKAAYQIKLNKEITNKEGKLISEYVNAQTKIEVECKKGHRWYTRPGCITRGNWCSRCKQSKGETKVAEILTEMNISFIQQARHPHILHRRYDFYFMVNNIYYLLEYDGRQHFDLSFYYRTQEEFDHLQNIDILKTFIAINTGYHFIRIDYTQINNIHDLIVSALISKNKLYLSSDKMYSWLLGSAIPLELLQRECSNLCRI